MNASEPSMKLCDIGTFCQKPIFPWMGEDCSGSLHTGYKANAIKGAWLLFRLLYGTQEVLARCQENGTNGKYP